MMCNLHLQAVYNSSKYGQISKAPSAILRLIQSCQRKCPVSVWITKGNFNQYSQGLEVNLSHQKGIPIQCQWEKMKGYYQKLPTFHISTKFGLFLGSCTGLCFFSSPRYKCYDFSIIGITQNWFRFLDHKHAPNFS